jgi:hypothetical protein
LARIKVNVPEEQLVGSNNVTKEGSFRRNVLCKLFYNTKELIHLKISMPNTYTKLHIQLVLARWLWRIFVFKSHVPDVIHYIQNQEIHHRKETFLDEYRRMLKVVEEYDEQYILKNPYSMKRFYGTNVNNFRLSAHEMFLWNKKQKIFSFSTSIR